MQQENANGQATDKSKEFLKNEQMGMDPDKQDNAGDDTFTPIYLTSNTTLETPGEKQREESAGFKKEEKVESFDEDTVETNFERLNNEDERTDADTQ